MATPIRPRLLNTNDRAAWAVPVEAGQDITDALQDTLDAAKAAGGGEVYIPAGHYYVDTNCGLTSATGVHVRGDGMGATIIEDSRARAAVAANGSYYGLLSFISSTSCSVAGLSMIGPVDPGDLGGAFGGGGASRSVYVTGSTNFAVMGLEAYYFTDECVYADGDSKGWLVQGCYIHDTQSNGINLNASISQAEGSRIIGNWVKNCHNGSTILAGAKSLAVLGNHCRIDTGAAVGADLVAIDTGSRTVFSGNVLHDTDISAAGVAALSIFGTQSSASSLTISDNLFLNIAGDFDDWSAGGAGAVHLNDCAGVATVSGNTFINCGRAAAFGDGAAFVVRGANTGRVSVFGNTVKKGSRNMETGLAVMSTVPAQAVYVGDNNFADCTTPFYIDSPARFGSAGLLAPGSYSLSSGQWHIQYKRLQMTGAERLTLAGTARYIITDL